jgi:hypothetical protein
MGVVRAAIHLGDAVEASDGDLTGNRGGVNSDGKGGCALARWFTPATLSPPGRRKFRSSCCPSPIYLAIRAKINVAHGITESLTTEAYGDTALKFKGKNVDPKQVLEGSVQRSVD